MLAATAEQVASGFARVGGIPLLAHEGKLHIASDEVFHVHCAG